MSELDAATGSLRTGMRRLVVVAALLIHGSVAVADCVGDCDNTGMVTISDLILGVNIVLGTQPPSACPAFQNGQGQVDIAQLVKGVNNALNGCLGAPTETPTTGNGDTPTSTATASNIPTPPATGTATSTMVETVTPTATSVATATSTATATHQEATAPPTHTPPSTATRTSSSTASATATGTATATASATPTPTSTFTASPTATQFPIGDTVAGRAAIIATGVGSVQSLLTAIVAQLENKGPMPPVLVPGTDGVRRIVVKPALCAIDGTTSKVCTEMGSPLFPTVHLSLTADECIATGPAGGFVVLNGAVTVDSDPLGSNGCNPVQFASGTYSADNLEVRFENDNLDTTLDVTANLTGSIAITNPDTNCRLGGLNLSLDGSLLTKIGDFSNGDAVQVDFAGTTVTMDRILYNGDCVPIGYRLILDGPATVQYIPPMPALVALNGIIGEQGVSVQFSTFVLAQNLDLTMEMTGTITSDCFGGAVGLQSFSPIAVTPGELCPESGGITVTSAGATAMVTYNQGEVTVDQNGMQQTFPICVADELLACPVPPA